MNSLPDATPGGTCTDIGEPLGSAIWIVWPGATPSGHVTGIRVAAGAGMLMLMSVLDGPAHRPHARAGRPGWLRRGAHCARAGHEAGRL